MLEEKLLKKTRKILAYYFINNKISHRRELPAGLANHTSELRSQWLLLYECRFHHLVKYSHKTSAENVC